MGNLDIGEAISSDLTNAIKDYSVDSETTDGVGDQKETTFTFEKWEQYLGYYKKIPELRAVIDAVATWTVGKGFIADEVTTMILDDIKGFGADTFNTILENAIRTYYINGDAFIEIINDNENNLLNLKPHDPSTIRIHANREGIVTKYMQISKTKSPDRLIKIENMIHLARNRVADEIHGVSVIESLEPIILMRNEAMDDWKRVLHHNIDPMIVFKLDTDDKTKIAAFKKTVDTAKAKGENMYLPKDTVEFEIISLAPNANLNALPWIEALNNYFYQACGVPQIIVSGGGEITEKAGNIAYLAFQQRVEEEQLFIEEQILNQLGFEINLEFPATIENELISDKTKDGPVNIDDSETTAGEGQ